MPPVLTKNGDTLEIALAGCRGFEFLDAKEKIKDIPGRRWDPETKNWIVPADPVTAQRVLKQLRPTADQSLLNWITESKTNFEVSLTTPLPPDDGKLLIPWAYHRAPWQPAFVNDTKVVGLLDHQRPVVKAIAERKRALLADDVGLGKTLMIFSAIEEFKLRNGQMEGPVLIAAPASVMGGWKREALRWLEDPNIVVIDGSWSMKKRTDALKEGIAENAYIVVNHEQLRVEKRKVALKTGGTKTVTAMKQPLLEETEWLAVVADEVHRFKNPRALQSKGLWRVQGQLMAGATATPVMNSPDELWSPLRWLWPDQYHEQGMRRNAIAYTTFYDEYVEYWEDHHGKKIITGVKNPDALKFVLKDKLIRRTSEVLGLKGRKRFYASFPLNPKQRELYDEAERSMWLAITEEVTAGNKAALKFAQEAERGVNLLQIQNGATRTVRLRQIIESPALLGGPDDSASMDDFESRYERSGFQPWVVFCAFKGSCTILAERLRVKYGARVGVYNGDVPPSKRTELEDAFQRGELDVMVGTIDAMNAGITLTHSHLMYFLSRSWVPEIDDQCEGREDRQGQTELVRVYIAQPEDTVATTNVQPTGEVKRAITATVIDKTQIQEAAA